MEISEEISEEQRELLRKRWAENGECRSCGWHNAYYEVQDSIEGSILSNDIEADRAIAMKIAKKITVAIGGVISMTGN